MNGLLATWPWGRPDARGDLSDSDWKTLNVMRGLADGTYEPESPDAAAEVQDSEGDAAPRRVPSPVARNALNLMQVTDGINARARPPVTQAKTQRALVLEATLAVVETLQELLQRAQPPLPVYLLATGDPDGDEADRGRIVVQIGDPDTASRVFGYVSQTVSRRVGPEAEADAAAGFFQAEQLLQDGQVEQLLRDGAAMIVSIPVDLDEVSFDRAAPDVDPAERDGQALFRHLAAAIGDGQPDVVLVGRGDGIAAAQVAQRLLGADTVRELPGPAPAGQPGFVLADYESSTTEPGPGSALRPMFGAGLSAQTTARLWQGLTKLERSELARDAADLVAGLDGIIDADRAEAVLRELARTMHDRPERTPRSAAFWAALNRADRLLFLDWQQHLVRPIALPLTGNPTQDRTFVGTSTLTDANEITVLVTRGEPTPGVLRIGMMNLAETLLDTQGPGRMAVAVWQGTNPERFARDMEALVEARRIGRGPEPRIRIVVVDEAGNALLTAAAAHAAFPAHGATSNVALVRRDAALPDRPATVDPALSASEPEPVDVVADSAPQPDAVNPARVVEPRPVFLPEPDETRLSEAAALWTRFQEDVSAELDARFAGMDESDVMSAMPRVRSEVQAQQWQRWDADTRALLLAHLTDPIAQAWAQLPTAAELPEAIADELNRERLRQERDALGANRDSTPADTEWQAELDDWVNQLKMLQRWAFHLPGHPRVRVLRAELDEQRQLVVAVGDGPAVTLQAGDRSGADILAAMMAEAPAGVDPDHIIRDALGWFLMVDIADMRPAVTASPADLAGMAGAMPRRGTAGRPMCGSFCCNGIRMRCGTRSGCPRRCDSRRIWQWSRRPCAAGGPRTRAAGAA